jgi:hypothetical protein
VLDVLVLPLPSSSAQNLRLMASTARPCRHGRRCVVLVLGFSLCLLESSQEGERGELGDAVSPRRSPDRHGHHCALTSLGREGKEVLGSVGY